MFRADFDPYSVSTVLGVPWLFCIDAVSGQKPQIAEIQCDVLQETYLGNTCFKAIDA